MYHKLKKEGLNRSNVIINTSRISKLSKISESKQSSYSGLTGMGPRSRYSKPITLKSNGYRNLSQTNASFERAKLNFMGKKRNKLAHTSFLNHKETKNSSGKKPSPTKSNHNRFKS